MEFQRIILAILWFPASFCEVGLAVVLCITYRLAPVYIGYCSSLPVKQLRPPSPVIIRIYMFDFLDEYVWVHSISSVCLLLWSKGWSGCSDMLSAEAQWQLCDICWLTCVIYADLPVWYMLTYLCDICWLICVIYVDLPVWYMLTYLCDICWLTCVIYADLPVWYMLTYLCDICWLTCVIYADLPVWYMLTYLCDICWFTSVIYCKVRNIGVELLLATLASGSDSLILRSVYICSIFQRFFILHRPPGVFLCLEAMGTINLPWRRYRLPVNCYTTSISATNHIITLHVFLSSVLFHCTRWFTR